MILHNIPPNQRHVAIHWVTWRHSNLWSRHDLYVVENDAELCEVNWWRFVTLLK